MGNITVELDAERAPLTVDNFLSYVAKGHYDGTIFHQVYRDQGIVGGVYSVDMTEKPQDPAIYNEAYNGLKNLRGTLAMARQPDMIHSATCHFFINVADNPELDHRDRNTPENYGYCVFGKVTEGMDVVLQIAAVEVEDTELLDRTPVQKLVIKSVRQIR
ncbi:MAG: peptidylprolyl isomerase [Pirellulales bacterium]|nr:peptidylprolyl isomerase [Pirellulales bacterium]